MAKATAVRNIRDDHQKAFLKIFNSLCGRFNRWQVWQDFVMVTAIEISNATDKQNAPERTKTYQTIISKYSDAEQNKFAELLAEVIMGMEQNPDQDFLGELYMLCELGNDASGQFFTPYDVCRCMVEISGGSDPAAENAGFFSVSDPACGAGALLIAFANLCRVGAMWKKGGVRNEVDSDYRCHKVDCCVRCNLHFCLCDKGWNTCFSCRVLNCSSVMPRTPSKISRLFCPSWGAGVRTEGLVSISLMAQPFTVTLPKVG